MKEKLLKILFKKVGGLSKTKLTIWAAAALNVVLNSFDIVLPENVLANINIILGALIGIFYREGADSKPEVVNEDRPAGSFWVENQ